jgi:hypothetical protein
MGQRTSKEDLSEISSNKIKYSLHFNVRIAWKRGRKEKRRRAH